MKKLFVTKFQQKQYEANENGRPSNRRVYEDLDLYDKTGEDEIYEVHELKPQYHSATIVNHTKVIHR